MNRIIVLIITFSVGFHVFAQLEIGRQNNQPQIPTWETYQQMIYGTIGTSLYTGTVNYSIPFYTYKDQDFEIPLALVYATNGLKANHYSGLLGHGWSLSCMGLISRKIKGIPDEKTMESSYIYPVVTPDNPSSNPFFNSTIKYYGYNHIDSKEALVVMPLYRQPNDQVTLSYEDTTLLNFYDYEPDEFTFNFCGYSGSFHMSSEKENGIRKFLIYDASGNSRGLKIKLVPDPLNKDSLCFEITDMNGYIFTFSRIEYVKVNNCDEMNQVSPTLEDMTLSWGLNSIKAPNGREIKFCYSEYNVSNNQRLYDDKIYAPQMYDYEVMIRNVEFGLEPTCDTFHSTYVLKYELKSINFADGTKAIFTTKKGFDEYASTSEKAHIDSLRLDRIDINSNGRIIKSCKLNYDTTTHNNQNNSNRVTFLKSADISGVGKYTFDYYNQNGRYPYLGTGEYDHWGYYNGFKAGFDLRTIAQFKQHLSYDSLGNETFISTIKNPSFPDAVSGTLCRISYPTGGYSTIEYEPHSYSRAVIRTSDSEADRTHFPFFQPTLQTLSDNEFAGGVRVKQIITYESDGTTNDTTTFDYAVSNNSDMSSGILIVSPRYGIEYTTIEGLKTVKYYNISNNLYDYTRTHIEYSHIKKTQSGRGFVTYDYSTSENEIDREYGEFEPDNDLPNGNRIPLLSWGRGDQLLSITSSKPIEMALTPMASFQTKRGKLLMESYYNNNNELLQEIINDYSYPLVHVDTMWQVVGEVAKKTYIPRFNVELTNTTTTDYSGDIAISKTENYTYNNLGLPTTVTTNTSDGNSLRTNLYYVCDSMSNTGVIADMVESHNLAQLLKKEQYKITNGIEKLVSAERLEYYHPDENNLTLACPIAKYSWLNGLQWKLAESYQYDNKGNLIERTDMRGISESYLWGYKGCYPVARVNNSSFDDLNQLLNYSANTIRDTATLSDNKFIELKNLGSQQLNSLYSLYRYRPGVGLTEVVKPNLSTTTYQYNGYGKLTEIRDNGGHLIEQYDYNIVTVEPLSATLECDTACYINRELTAVIACNGGSGLYSYRWAIIKANGDTSIVDSVTSIVLSPLDLLIPSGQYCTIVCNVHDVVSGESLSLNQSVYIKPSILHFEDIVENVNPSNSSAIVTASIYCDNNVSAQFCFERICTGQCSVSVGNSSYSNFTNKTTYFYMPLHPGWNNVTLTVTNAETAEVELSIVSAAGHDIGQPSSISAQI